MAVTRRINHAMDTCVYIFVPKLMYLIRSTLVDVYAGCFLAFSINGVSPRVRKILQLFRLPADQQWRLYQA